MIKGLTTTLALSALLLQTSVQAQLDDPNYNYLLGYWNAEESAADSSSYDNNGTEFGVVSYEQGILGQAFALEQGWIDFGNNPVFNFGPNDFTLSLWVNFQSLEPQVQVLLEKFSDGYPDATGVTSNSTGWSLYEYYNPDSEIQQVRVGLYADGQSQEFFPPISTYEWHQLVVTRSQNVVKHYFDGSLYEIFDTFPIDIVQNDAPLLLGRRSNDQALFAKALLDEIKIYSIALDESQVKESYEKLMNPPIVAPTPPPSYYYIESPTASPTEQPDQDLLVFKYFIFEVIDAIQRLERCRHSTCLERRSRRLFRVFRRASRNGLITREQFDILEQIIKLATTEKKRDIGGF